MLNPIIGDPVTLLTVKEGPKPKLIDCAVRVFTSLGFWTSNNAGVLLSTSYPLTYALPGETL